MTKQNYEISRDGSRWVVWAVDVEKRAGGWHIGDLIGTFTSRSKAEAFVARMQAEGN